MEGMPRVPMLHPEPKAPANQYTEDFRLKIKEYILLHYQDDPSKYDGAITEIINMKQSISKSYTDVETACILKRYYAQLLMMKNRFPMEEGDSIKVLYSWYDRAMDIAHSATYDDIGFELASVMYNIGAVHASIAVNESREDENSIKNAFMHFQYAAWPLQHLRDNMNASKYASIDFDKELLTFFINVLLGQAQECLLEKSLIDHRSNIVVTKLAVHLRDRYQECLRHLENSNLCDYVSSKKFKLWSRTCAIKSEMYGSIAMVHMGCHADEEKRMGARYGYYKIAEEHLTSIIKLAEKEDRDAMKSSIAFLSDVVVTKLNNAKKENEFIFHDRIPNNQELCENIEGLCKVRPLSFDPLDISVGGEDLFGALLPPGVIKALSEYEEEKDKLKRRVLEQVSQKDDELNAFLLSLRIDEIDLEADSAMPILPDMLLERNAALTTQPDAIPKLLENLQSEVGDLAREADAKLSGLTGRLADVDIPEITSDEGYKAVKNELDRLNEHHQKARSNNVELHKAIAAHTTNLHLLSLPLDELNNKLAGPSINAGSTPEGATLRRLLEKTREMQNQRSVLVQRLTEEINSDNIAKKLLAEKNSNHEETYATELKKHESTKKYLDANLEAQEKILSALTEANADFSDYRKKIKAQLNTRSEHIMTLVTAYDVYCDVCNKVEDGRNFYKKLLDRLSKLAIAVEGIETAFASERGRRDVEKISQEEELALFKRASEAHDALSDFTTGKTYSVKPEMQNFEKNAARPRLGDYMEFYRKKMSFNTGKTDQFIPPVETTIHQRPSPILTHPNVHYDFPPAHFPCMNNSFVAARQQQTSTSSGTAGGIFINNRYSKYALLLMTLHPFLKSTSLPHHNQECVQVSLAGRRLSATYQPSGLTLNTVHPGTQNPSLVIPQHLLTQPTYQSVYLTVVSNPKLITMYGQFVQINQPHMNHIHSLPTLQTPLHLSASTSESQFHQHYDTNTISTVATSIASVNYLGTSQEQQQNASQLQTIITPHDSVQHRIMGVPTKTLHHPSRNSQEQLGELDGTFSKDPISLIQSGFSTPRKAENVLMSSKQFVCTATPVNAINTNTKLVSHNGMNELRAYPWATNFTERQIQQSSNSSLSDNNGKISGGNIMSQTPAPLGVLSYGQNCGQSCAVTDSQNAPLIHQRGCVPVNQEMPTASSILTCQDTPWSQALHQSTLPIPQTPYILQQTPVLTTVSPASMSPWHSKMVTIATQSPWHAGLMSGTPSLPPVQELQQTHLIQEQAKSNSEPPKYHSAVVSDIIVAIFLIECHLYKIARHNFKDLLDGISDSTNLPPAMIPTPKPVETQNLQQTCASSISSSSETATLPASYQSSVKPVVNASEIISIEESKTNPRAQTTSLLGHSSSQYNQILRPAAAVMPIQYYDTCVETRKTSSILPLSDITDPKKFELGPGDKTRLEKRLLHEHIRRGGSAPVPKLDLNDPLNTIDPFWKTK
ncbi:BRO1-like domain protein [Dictyocaulus viviparus]|uniref:BRO1-like domain protein n=1 Tax=Dictyocaulus viviparus TaxID=29172 RepID=A0A0D8XP11_DICVI|nr:BRO1-like domain protein [Dictyocaulus viviparus]